MGRVLENRLEVAGNHGEVPGDSREVTVNYAEFSENCLEIAGNHGEVPGDSREGSGSRPGNYGLSLEGSGASREFRHVQREHGDAPTGSPGEAVLQTDSFFEQDIEGGSTATVTLTGNPRDGCQFIVENIS